jgi:hypothetical protein
MFFFDYYYLAPGSNEYADPTTINVESLKPESETAISSGSAVEIEGATGPAVSAAPTTAVPAETYDVVDRAASRRDEPALPPDERTDGNVVEAQIDDVYEDVNRVDSGAADAPVERSRPGTTESGALPSRPDDATDRRESGPLPSRPDSVTDRRESGPLPNRPDSVTDRRESGPLPNRPDTSDRHESTTSNGTLPPLPPGNHTEARIDQSGAPSLPEVVGTATVNADSAGQRAASPTRTQQPHPGPGTSATLPTVHSQKLPAPLRQTSSELLAEPWYFGSRKDDATAYLTGGKAPGTFAMRDSSSHAGESVLSYDPPRPCPSL